MKLPQFFRAGLVIVMGCLVVVPLVGTRAEADDSVFAFYKSTDRARVWSRVGNGLPSTSRINALNKVNDTMVAGTDSGIYVSADQGDSWRPAHQGTIGGGEPPILCFASLQGLVLAGTQRHGLLFSRDAGASWLIANEGLEDLYVRSLLAVGNRIYAGTDSRGVFVSDDSGRSWKELSAGLPASVQIFDLTAFNSIVFAGLYSNGLFRLDALAGAWIQAGEVRPLALAATNEALLAGHNPGGVFVSHDLGKSWRDGNFGLPLHAPIWNLGSNGDLVLAGTTGEVGATREAVGLFISEDHGQTWTKANTGLPAGSAAISFLTTRDFILAGVIHKNGAERSSP